MSAFTKKPVTIEAVRLQAGEIPGDTFIHEGIVAGTLLFREDSTCLVRTNHGIVIAHPGEWIIRQVTGELYPCNDETFQATYTKAGELPSRLTPADVQSVIVSESYHRLPGTTFMVCFLTLRNGYVVTGESACADPALYDQATGEKYARENAVEKIWTLEGYLLRERLAEVAAPICGQDRAVEAPSASQDLRSRGEPRVPPAA